MQPTVETFFDPATFSFTHLVYCSSSLEAAIIDPVMDFNQPAMRTTLQSANKILDRIKQLNLNTKWILETHAHADHLTAAQFFKQQTQAQVAIGECIDQVQDTFNQLFELSAKAAGNPNDFDRLLKDGERIPLGDYEIEILHTPGHTPSCCTYRIGDCAFVGDTLFMPDFGTARCDFPGGDAGQLYDSISKILQWPDDTRLYMCHDYQPGGRELKWITSVGEQKQANIHIKQGTSRQDFINMRTQRDKQLDVPRLILPSLQVNIRAGKLPEPEPSGSQFIRLPLNKL